MFFYALMDGLQGPCTPAVAWAGKALILWVGIWICFETLDVVAVSNSILDIRNFDSAGLLTIM